MLRSAKHLIKTSAKFTYSVHQATSLCHGLTSQLIDNILLNFLGLTMMSGARNYSNARNGSVHPHSQRESGPTVVWTVNNITDGTLPELHLHGNGSDHKPQATSSIP